MIDHGSAGKVPIVDDESLNIDVLTRVLRRDGYEVISASNGAVAIETVASDSPDVVLMDINMPVVGGLEACRRLKRHPATRLLPVILMTGLNAATDRIAGIDAGADDFLSKPFAFDELRARVRSLRRIKRYTDELESAESLILSLALTIEARDPATKGHCDRLARYAVTLGEALGLDGDDLRALHLGGYLHDLGKIGVPDAVALTTVRPYKPAFTRERACCELREEARRGWKHQQSVEAWIDVLYSGVIDQEAPAIPRA